MSNLEVTMPLTKKEKEILRSDKVQIVKNAEGDGLIVFMHLTLGELLALKNALDQYPTIVGQDVRDYVNNALQRANISF